MWQTRPGAPSPGGTDARSAGEKEAMMPCILVIDDDYATRALFRQVLERAGYDVVEASTGQEGVQVYQSRAIDAVITDLLMPGDDGLTTLRTLQARTPGVKCIAMSAGAYVGVLDLLHVAQQWGAQRVVRKPVSCQELLAVVQGLLAEDEEGC
jgi:CheY-like chemotaxis protein